MADQRFQAVERVVGANHPTLTDTINRLTLVGHNTDGTHKSGIGSVDCSAYTDLDTAVSTIGATVTTLVISTAVNMTDDTTIPATLCLQVVNGGSIAIPTAKTLTIDGPFTCGLTQCFDLTGTGAVVFGSGSVAEVLPEWWGAVADNSTDCTSAILAAMASVDTTAPNNGGVIRLSAGVYFTTGITVPSYITIIGAGAGTTILKLKASTTADVVTVPLGSTAITLKHLTVDGNKVNNVSTGGHGITFDTTTTEQGGSNALSDKTSQASYSYKWGFIENVCCTQCTGDGFNVPVYNFSLFVDNCVFNYNDGYGAFINGTDSIFTNIYYEKNGKSGLKNTGGNNKFANSKAIWNGSIDDTEGAIHNNTSRVVMVSMEAQDNYTHGFYLSGDGNTFIGLLADTNGYDKTLGAGYSSRVHSGFYIYNLTASHLEGCVRSYKSVVGTDGYWTTEYPYTQAGTNTLTRFVVPYPSTRVNSPPTTHDIVVSNQDILYLRSNTGGSGETLLSIDPMTTDSAKGSYCRFFRNVTTSGFAGILVCAADGTNTEVHRISAKGDVGIGVNGSAAYNQSHLQLGNYHLWIDSSGRLRIKSSAPASDTDGTIVGTQT